MTILTPATSGNTDTPYSKLAYNEESLVAQATETSIVTLSPTSVKRIKQVVVSGDLPAVWRVYIDAALYEKYVVMDYSDRLFLNISLNAGQALDVKVEHNYSVLDAKFNATIYGF